MAAAIRLREDFEGPSLHGLAKRARNTAEVRRLLALAEIYEGGPCGDAARIGGVGLQTVRDWVLRFNARGPEGVIDRKALGKVPKLNAAQRQALVQTVESGPIPAIHGTAPNISALTAHYRVERPQWLRRCRTLGLRRYWKQLELPLRLLMVS